MRAKHWLYTEEGRNYLNDRYVAKKLSTYEVAEEHDSYANMVRRALIFHGIPIRDKSEAQKVALKSGRTCHPMQHGVGQGGEGDE